MRFDVPFEGSATGKLTGSIAGVDGLLENPFASPSFEQYLHLAGLVSLFSFMVNYDPMLFGRIISRITTVVDKRSGQDDHEQ